MGFEPTASLKRVLIEGGVTNYTLYQSPYIGNIMNKPLYIINSCTVQVKHNMDEFEYHVAHAGFQSS